MYSIDHKRIFNILVVHPIHARLFQALITVWTHFPFTPRKSFI